MTNESYEKLKQLIESIESVDKSLIDSRSLIMKITSILLPIKKYDDMSFWPESMKINDFLGNHEEQPLKRQLEELNKFRYTGVDETPIVFAKDSSAAPFLDNISITTSTIGEPEIPII